MKKIILSAAVAAAALFGAYTAQQASEVAFSDLQVEMLAEGEILPYYIEGEGHSWGTYIIFSAYSNNEKVEEGTTWVCDKSSSSPECSHGTRCTNFTKYHGADVNKINDPRCPKPKN